jgi:RNA polymerase sigma-70 factor (ECF subfamily)
LPYPRQSLPARLLADDEGALAQVGRWIAEVITAARFRALRPEWADLHQEVLLRIVESLRSEHFDPAYDFRTYVQAIARYTSYRALARRRRRPPSIDPDVLAAGDAPSPGSPPISLQSLRSALDAASPECRDLIRAYFLLERSYTEIARESGLPLGTVKSRLFRCLGRLRRAILGRPPARRRREDG